MRKSAEKLAQKMIWLRIAQMLINEEYKANKFKIPIHLALGHEAIATAIDAVTSPHDKLVLSHRNIAYNLIRSSSFQKVLDEYLLKETGLAAGRLGSMNLATPHHGIVYSSSILGNNFPVAAGMALARKTHKEKGVVIVLGGDGSMEEGSFYETLIIAKSWKLPLLIIIENNEWSLATHIKERRCEIDLKKMAAAVGIPFVYLSGNQTDSYIKTLTINKKKAEKKGPLLVEVDVKTLGDWYKKEAGGKHFVNYHAGPAHVIKIDSNSIIIKSNNTDPLHVLKNKIGEKKFQSMVDEEFDALNPKKK